MIKHPQTIYMEAELKNAEINKVSKDGTCDTCVFNCYGGECQLTCYPTPSENTCDDYSFILDANND